MLKLAVIGAQTLLGRELVQALEQLECSVLPLAVGPMSAKDEEDNDLVVFAPEPALLESLDTAILADAPHDPSLIENFKGRVLDLREDGTATGEPMPLTGPWPEGTSRLRGRPAIELALAMVPSLVHGAEHVHGVHLRSVAHLGEKGIHGLADQTRAILDGFEPDVSALGYRAAFEAIPMPPKENLVEIMIPTFHGDILVLNIRGRLQKIDTPENIQDIQWLDAPPTSRDVAISDKLLLHYAPNSGGAVLVMGFDPILWGTLQPVARLLGLK
ncbi:MAG: hypothetical protein LBC63_09400 [Holophagales bacterium]|jgi:hypothetical protein|nr:hypothetical protein [Holophagales bacterium]